MLTLSAAEYSAIFLSLKVSVVATLLSLPLSFAMAYILTYRQFRGKIVLDVIVNLPLTLPPVVIGYLLLLGLGQNGFIGQHILQPLGITLIFTWKAAVIATAVVGFPLMVRSIRIGMETIDQRLIQASRTLGAGWFDSMVTVILPLSIRGVLAGSALMFARGLGEFGATIIVAGNMPGVTQTMWTFGGSVPGPVLRGKVGDTFEVTLVNSGQNSHSIDFHASKVAWNDEMRSIAPGDAPVNPSHAKHRGPFHAPPGSPSRVPPSRKRPSTAW